MILTPWYPSRVRPIHEGVYEIRFTGWLKVNKYALWDGAKWGWAASTPDYAAEFPLFHYDPNQAKQWRGVRK
jgi:hypothetical protein